PYTTLFRSNTASEAMVAALPVLAVEGRTLLAVERAARPVVTLGRIRLPAIPRHARADDRGNRHPVPDLVKEGRGKAHRQARLSFIYPPAASVTTPIAAPSEAMPGIHKTAKRRLAGAALSVRPLISGPQ